jgi:phage terminase small subunit
MKPPRTAKVPTYLRAETQAWMRSVLKHFVLEDHHIHLLRLCCEALDRTEQARELLAKDGLVCEGREGLKPHPAIAIERDSRVAVARLLRELALDFDDAPPASRPPPLRGVNRGRIV